MTVDGFRLQTAVVWLFLYLMARCINHIGQVQIPVWQELGEAHGPCPTPER